MTRGLVGTAVFICAVLLVSSAFAGKHRVHQRARLDHYARPTPDTSRLLHSRMQARMQQQRMVQQRLRNARQAQNRAIQRLQQRARFMDDYSPTRRVVRHVRATTHSQRHVKGPKQLTQPPKLINKIRCAGLEDQCLPAATQKPAAQQATKSSSKRPKTGKDKLPPRAKERRDSVIRCPDGDCSI